MKTKFNILFEQIMNNTNTDIKDFNTLKQYFLNLAIQAKLLCEDNSWDNINKTQNAIQTGLDFLDLPYESIDELSPKFVNPNILSENKNK